MDLSRHINNKESLALLTTLRLYLRDHGADALRGCRVMAEVDNMVLHQCHVRGGGRNMQMVHDLREIFWLQVNGGFMLDTRWISTHVNVTADGLTREETAHDRRLTDLARILIYNKWGLPTLDWCASDANVFCDPVSGSPLPFVSQYACPGSVGVDVLSLDMSCLPQAPLVPVTLGYAFPPVPLLGPLVHHASLCRARLILVVESCELLHSWFATVVAHQQGFLLLGRKGCLLTMMQHSGDGQLVPSVLQSDLHAYLLDFS